MALASQTKSGYRARKPNAIDTSGDPQKLTSSVVDLAKFIEDEFAAVATSTQSTLQMQISYVAPSKPRLGMVVYADGTHWNPGSGEGPYAYGSDNTWHPLEYVAPAPVVDTTPIGKVEWYAGTRAPSAKFLAADGTTFLRATYPDLLAYLIHSSTVTFTNGSANIVWTTHGFKYLNEPIKFYGATLPTNFTLGTPGTGGTFYYLKQIVDANTITVSATPGSVAIVAGSAGSGTHTAVNAPWGDGDNSTTAHLPNILGEFIRAWDAQRGIDVARGFGADQLDALQGHFHSASGSVAAGPSPNVPSSGPISPWIAGGPTAVTVTVTGPTTDGSHGTPRTDSETRPRNQTLFPFVRVLA